MTAPRVRFAPSPSGSLHVGNARTAVVNWLYARQTTGRFVLRIEDTDAARTRAEAEGQIFEDLRWLGVVWDEGPDVGGPHAPYRQSERRPRYAECLARLLESGLAYPCFASAERIEHLRAEARAAGVRFLPPDRALDPREARRRLAAGEPAAIRFRVPERPVRFEDLLRGQTGVPAGQLEDFVVGRSDGTATYQLAVVIDDHDMGITHVIRGQDHLSNTPRQILLYEAFGWPPPRFAHLPLVLGRDRSPLSKRHGSVSVGQLRAEGVLPEALFNYLVLLGWAPPDDREVLTPEEILESWRLDAVSAANAVFDRDKLEWLNQQHIARLPAPELLARAEPFLRAAGHAVPARGGGRRWWCEALDLFRPSVRSLAEFAALVRPLLEPVASPALAERLEADVRAALTALAQASRADRLGDPVAFRAAVERIAARTGVRGRRLMQPLRLAVTGREHGPELARLVPLIERAARQLRPPPPTVADRLAKVLEHDG